MSKKFEWQKIRGPEEAERIVDIATGRILGGIDLDRFSDDQHWHAYFRDKYDGQLIGEYVSRETAKAAIEALASKPVKGRKAKS